MWRDQNVPLVCCDPLSASFARMLQSSSVDWRFASHVTSTVSVMAQRPKRHSSLKEHFELMVPNVYSSQATVLQAGIVNAQRDLLPSTMRSRVEVLPRCWPSACERITASQSALFFSHIAQRPWAISVWMHTPTCWLKTLLTIVCCAVQLCPSQTQVSTWQSNPSN